MLEVLAIEVTGAAVRALRVSRFGPGRGVRAYTERPLPPGLLVPSSSAPNIQDEAAFTRILTEAVGPHPPHHARLVLPDRSVRFHVLHADAGAPAGGALRDYLLWRLQDTLPFEPREARVAYVPVSNRAPNRQVVITLVAREQVLAQYERILAAAGSHAAHMAPAVSHLLKLAERAPQAAEASAHGLLALGPETTTLVLSQRGIPEYARTFGRPGVEPDLRRPAGGPQDVPHPPHAREHPRSHKELIAELLRSFDHAAEEAGVRPPTVVLLGGEMGQDVAVAAALQEGLGIPCTVLPPPTHRARRSGQVPPEAHAVLSAALTRV